MRFIKAVFVIIICQLFLLGDVVAQNNDTIIKGYVHSSQSHPFSYRNIIALYIRGEDDTYFAARTDSNGNYAVMRSQIKGGVNYLITAKVRMSYDYKNYYLKTQQLFIPSDYARAPYMLNFDLEEISYCENSHRFFSFDLNSDKLNKINKLDGKACVELLHYCSSITILIRGHADASEKHPFKLSENRAKGVMKYLADHGIDKARMQITGIGDLVGQGIEYYYPLYKEIIAEDISKHERLKEETRRLNSCIELIVTGNEYGVKK